MATDEVIRHREQVHPGSWVIHSLTPKGLLQEEFTSGVKTHTDLIYYDEIWDYCQVRRLSKWKTLALLAGTAGALLALFLPGVGFSLLLPVWAILGVAWWLQALALKVTPIELYDFEGRRLAVIRGDKAPVQAFLRELVERARTDRYPLQGVFESLDLGACEVKAPFRRWKGTLLYDRVVFEDRTLGGFRNREFFALTSLRAPVRLLWRGPKTVVGLAVLAAMGSAPAAYLAWGGQALLRNTALLLAAIAILCAAGLVAGTRVSVTMSNGGGLIQSLPLPWWKMEERRRILRWFAAVVKLADSVDLIRNEDYWDYHRSKLEVLRKSGFLDEWPYRSTLSRLNTRQREEFGD